MKNTIESVIENYFQGTHTGSADLLREAFLEDAHISGNFNGTYVDFSLDDFIARVEAAATENPGAVFDKTVLDIKVQGDIALVTAKVLVGDIYCIDFINLIQCDGIWKIRHKSFTTAID